MRACLGALAGIAVTGGSMYFVPGMSTAIPFLIAPMGASAVLLFAVPASPLAQPWSIVGGNLVSAFVGVTCAMLIAQPVEAAACAVALAIGAMFALRCVHPPSGAVALTAVLGGSSVHSLHYEFVLAPVGVQSLLLLGTALAYHAATGHRYPHAGLAASAGGSPMPAATGASAGPQPRTGEAMPSFTRDDLDAALRRHGEWIDVAPDDLEALLRDLQRHAYVRASSDVTAADIMSPPPATVPATASVGDAWDLLHHHGVEALPVTDHAHRLTGMVTRARLHAAGLTHGAVRFRALRSRIAGFRGVGRAAHAPVAALTDAAHHAVSHTHAVVDLLGAFASGAHAHLPVLDDEGRLAGIVTQSDLIAGLHRQTHRFRRQAA